MSELEAYKEAYKKLIDANDNYHQDDLEFAVLFDDAENLVSDYHLSFKQNKATK